MGTTHAAAVILKTSELELSWYYIGGTKCKRSSSYLSN